MSDREKRDAGERTAVELVWSGTMAIEAGALKPGQRLKAYFCIVLEGRDGKIFRQRNYDCFESFGG
ncbi:MAG TPA: hypothetical protein VM598_03280 [Bdellovibrionota bacterium]|nr:hypothetical protein [Bdellovibrionota bacterium]